jgi:hypothetical protein
VQTQILTAITDRVEDLLAESARSLKRSLANYWPADHESRNDIAERNLSLHFAHAMLCQGFSVFAEADHPDSDSVGIQGIDLLALSPANDWFLAFGAKRIFSFLRIASVLADVERLASFWLNHKLDFDDSICSIVRGCNLGVGIVGGLSWLSESESKIYAFWDNPQDWLGDERGIQLHRRIKELNGTWMKPFHVRKYLSGEYYLLAAYFPINRLVVSPVSQ